MCALAILYGVIIGVENLFGPQTRSGAEGSSYSTTEAGIKAWSELLFANGYDVTQQRGAVDVPEFSNPGFYMSGNPISLDRTSTTLIILAGALPTDELAEVRDFVRGGGRLITDNPNILEAIVGDSITPQVEGDVELKSSGIAVDGMDGIEALRGKGVGSLTFSGNEEAVPLVVSQNNVRIIRETRFVATAAAIRVGDGDVIALMDIGIVDNEGIGLEDNALFALRIAGSSDSEVIFAEGVHGYDEARGFAGLPQQWKFAIIGLFAAFVIYLTSIGRRFGVGEVPHRNLGPRRIFFAHALAQTLRKSKGYIPRQETDK